MIQNLAAQIDISERSLRSACDALGVVTRRGEWRLRPWKR